MLTVLLFLAMRKCHFGFDTPHSAHINAAEEKMVA